MPAPQHEDSLSTDLTVIPHENLLTIAPTKTEEFYLNGHHLKIQVWNTKDVFAWRIVVNNNPSQISSYYPGILEHHGWCIATSYWEGTFDAFIPFYVEYAKETKG